MKLRGVDATTTTGRGRRYGQEFLDERRTRIRMLLDFLKRLLGKEPAAPGDPYAYVTALVRRGPKGRSAAAVAEIEEDSYNSYPPRRSGG